MNEKEQYNGDLSRRKPQSCNFKAKKITFKRSCFCSKCNKRNVKYLHQRERIATNGHAG